LVHAATTIDAANHYGYGANLGWLDWRGDNNNGAVIGEYACSGYIYAANVGWISLGNGSPTNGIAYQNLSANDFGVNRDSLGNLRGYAYGANIGWINFESTGAPKAAPTTGEFSGYAWSANCGWISVSNTFAYVQTDSIRPAVPTPPQLVEFAFAPGSGLSFNFTDIPGASFTVHASTNVALPFSNWTVLGAPVETPEGSYSLYQFTDPQATNGSVVSRFYRVSSP
jgi:hypothetical protein